MGSQHGRALQGDQHLLGGAWCGFQVLFALLTLPLQNVNCEQLQTL